MSWTIALRAAEMDAFRRCRRQWDFASRLRRNHVRRVPRRFDLDRAVHDALAVYYLPAMDDWHRNIVRPLALQAFRRRMDASRSLAEAAGALDEAQRRDWREEVARGERLLQHFFAWVAELDDFDSLLSDHEFWAGIPDPEDPETDLVSPEGWPLRCQGRIDQLICIDEDQYWIVEHRVVDEWESSRTLLEDRLGRSFAWAIQLTYPQLRVAGNIYNELRCDRVSRDAAAEAVVMPPERDKRDMQGGRHINRRRDYLSAPHDDVADPVLGSDVIVRQEGNARFRRSYVRRSRASLARMGAEIAADVRTIMQGDIVVSPRHTEESCSRCIFRDPCDAMEAGRDPAAILAADYRTRTPEEMQEEERLRWAATVTAAGPTPGAPSLQRNVRARWG